MKNFSIVKYISHLIRIFVLFLICLIWSRYFIYDNLALSIFVAILLSFVIDFAINSLTNRKKNKNNIKNDENKKIQNYANSFLFSTPAKSVDFFYQLATIKHQCTKHSKFVTIKNEKSNIVLYPFFLHKIFCEDDLITIYKSLYNTNFNRLIICTIQVDVKVFDLASKLPKEIFILDSTETYQKLYKHYNKFPDEFELKTENSKDYKKLLTYALNKKRTKSYFVASLFLIFSSFFTPLKIYYLIVSTILLLLTFISLFNVRFNKTPIASPLDD